MAEILFAKNLLRIEVEPGSNLMQSLLRAGLPVASSCYGKGICTKCKVIVVAGAENLSQPNALENRAREQSANSRNQLADNERLSCQTRLIKDSVTLDTTYW